MQPDSSSIHADYILALPVVERVAAIRDLCNLDRSAAVDALEVLLDNPLDANSTTTAIKMLGSVGDTSNIETLLRFYEAHRTAVIKALLGIGVFDDALPTDNRERAMVRHALNHAKPELPDLIRDGGLTRQTLRSVLPPIM